MPQSTPPSKPRRGTRAAVAWVVALLLVTGGAGAFVAPARADAKADAKLRAKKDAAKLANLARALGVEIVDHGVAFPVQSTHGAIAGGTAAEADLAIYRPLLWKELGRYPAAFLRKTGLKRFVLCKDLAFNGQLRHAVPDFPHDTLYLGVNWPPAFRGAQQAAFILYLRKVFHHELFHVIDWKDDGDLYRDPAWLRLNPPAFRYGRGGINMQDDPTVSLISDQIPGFLNGYSTAGVEEDKAEIYANLMANSVALAERAHRDAVIRKKVLTMAALLVAFSDEARELLVGVGVLPDTRLSFVRAAVAGTGAGAHAPEIDAARKAGRPILLYASRWLWPVGKSAPAARAAKLEAGPLSDAAVVAAAEGWSRFVLDLGDPAIARLAKGWSVRKAPALLVWLPASKRPKRLAKTTGTKGLLRTLEAAGAPAK